MRVVIEPETDARYDYNIDDIAWVFGMHRCFLNLEMENVIDKWDCRFARDDDGYFEATYDGVMHLITLSEPKYHDMFKARFEALVAKKK